MIPKVTYIIKPYIDNRCGPMCDGELPLVAILDMVKSKYDSSVCRCHLSSLC